MTVVPLPTRTAARPRAVPSQFRKSAERDTYTVAEVSTRLGLSLGGTYELVRDGTIPARKLGGRWVIPIKRFHAWLDGFEAEDQADEPGRVPATQDHTRKERY
jgi:excisionase family DNA binding protein